jgi:hypothetical protein
MCWEKLPLTEQGGRPAAAAAGAAGGRRTHHCQLRAVLSRGLRLERRLGILLQAAGRATRVARAAGSASGAVEALCFVPPSPRLCRPGWYRRRWCQGPHRSKRDLPPSTWPDHFLSAPLERSQCSTELNYHCGVERKEYIAVTLQLPPQPPPGRQRVPRKAAPPRAPLRAPPVSIHLTPPAVPTVLHPPKRNLRLPSRTASATRPRSATAQTRCRACPGRGCPLGRQ